VSKHILILTGQRGGGKTTVCRQVVAQAQAAGFACGGLLTPNLDGSDQRVVVDVRSGESRPLTTNDGEITLGRFRFDPAALEWGTQRLADAVPCDLLVVDEIGPLEIERQQGWSLALDLLRGHQFRLALVVVRPELIEAVQMRLPTSAPTVVTVTPDNRDLLPVELADLLKREAATMSS